MPDALPPLIRALLAAPACYDHAVEKLELIETHISWVLLTGSYVYKIKKPVNLGFLDFSTLERRRQDCLEELRLNRRLAADIYLDVVAITGIVDAPRINGVGEALEYAVKMRQFPGDATLDKLAERGELGEVQIDALAARLAHFHLSECEHAATDSPWGEPDAVARPVTENFQMLAARLDAPAEVQRLVVLQNWCNAEHLRLAPLMRARKQHGFVRECHGDLHLANLAWVDGKLVIFDCLEFSPALRWTDVISEVAFCYMDLLHRGYAGLASRFLNAWLEATGDYEGVALLRYYAVYRALVRAKVASLRAEQGCRASRAEVSACLQLAEQLALSTPLFPLSRNNLGRSPLVVRGMPLHSATGAFAPSLRGNALHSGMGDLSPYIPWEDPCGLAALRHPTSLSLTITHGLSGSGKTTLSQQMLEKHGMIRLRSDVERKRLAGLSACARGGEVLGLYSASFGLRTYQYLAERAEDLLASGFRVVVDAAFLQRWERDMFRDLAKRSDADFRILDIPSDPAVLRERVRLRQAEGNDASDAGLRVLEQQLLTAQPLGEDELAVCLDMELM
ncbi:MAG: AAA family ATPase [Gallionella sp.]|nr:AAA family ATPase [Gallionella sp.]